MVCNFTGIDEDKVFVHASHDRLFLRRGELLCKGIGLLLHGVREVLRVRTRVGEQLLFVQVLSAIENLLGAIFKALVAFFLQFRQVERFLRELLLLLDIDFCNRNFCRRTAPLDDRIRFRLFLENRNL